MSSGGRDEFALQELVR